MGHGIPVLMYHSIGRIMPEWHWAALTLVATTFESHLRALSRGGYTTVGLPELFEYVSKRRSLPKRTVVLTFDDGYLDNWTHAVPLLRRYGFCATVLVTPEFVDPRDIQRPSLDDVWAGRMQESDIEVRGFMSWKELAAASADGTLDVQAHGLTHAWYPISSDVVDFHRPLDNHYWLDWNANPDGKPFYLNNLGKSRVAWGTPVYRHAKALEATTFRPDPVEAAFVAERVANSADPRNSAAVADVAASALADYRARHGVRGEFESDAERRTRFERELADSKHIIESRLGKPVRHFVWPGGGYCDESLEMALAMFDSVTWSGPDRWKLRNRPGEDPRLVTRRGIHYVQARSERVFTGGTYLQCYLDEYGGRPGARLARQTMKMAAMAGLFAGVWPRNGNGRIFVGARS